MAASSPIPSAPVLRLALAFLAVAWGYPAAITHAEPLRPNIIVFLVDDYDKPETSVYGGKVLTPNLDRLAREGMVFHNAHVTSTVCTPSRYTFLTGRYAGSSHSTFYREECPVGQQGLPSFNVGLEPDNMNVGRVLAEAGYATGFVGKYHVHDADHRSPIQGLHPIAKNTEYSKEVNRMFFENEKRQREMIKERGFTWAENIHWANTKAPFKGHNPDWTIKAALEFVKEHHATSTELIQNTDFVPTWFDVAGAKLPRAYHIDGVSLLPVFKDPSRSVRDYVYGEQGPARSVKTKDWNYITLRYTSDQIADLEGPRGDRRAKTLLGLSGGISRAPKTHPGAFDVDQLYHLATDPGEMKNLAGNPEQKEQLARMRAMLTQALQKFPDRPYGEFVKGGNALPAESSKPVLKKLSKIGDL